MSPISVFFSFTVVAVVSAATGRAQTTKPTLAEWQLKSDIPSPGLHCQVQEPGSTSFTTRAINGSDFYDAIVHQPGVMGLKSPTGFKDDAGHDLWTMEWLPKDTNIKTISINWAFDANSRVFWKGANTTVVSLEIRGK